MLLVDFYISNPGHHVAMMQPVIARLKAQREIECRVISLCEFRGFHSPQDRFSGDTPLIKIPSRRFRSGPSGGKQTGSSASKRGRDLLRRLLWHLLLKRPIYQALRARPSLVVLPNDAAFPYDRIVCQLHKWQIPFVLLQEGIRFPLPGVRHEEAYGRGGAAVIAAWGETSANYFQAQGVPASKIRCMGTPRFDHIFETDWQAKADRLAQQFTFGQENLLFLSNPIDDQGFCSTTQKMGLVRRFLQETTPLFDNPDFHLIFKLHPRESVADFQSVAAEFPFSAQITVLGAVPLYPLFKLARAAIVLASTVGLEALMFSLPLAVLEIPGTGFAYDYVDNGAALGLTWTRPMPDQVERLLQAWPPDTAVVQAYLQQNLALPNGSAVKVAHLVEDLLK